MADRTRRRKSNPLPLLAVELLLLVVLGAVLWVKFTPQGRRVWADFRGQEFVEPQGGAVTSNRKLIEAEHQAAVELEKLKTIVVAERIAPGSPDKRVTSLSFRQKEIDDATVQHIANLFRIQSLDLGRTNLSDDQLRSLSGMHSVANLGLSSTRITDAGLVHIEGLTGVKALHMTHTKISDDGLPHIAKMAGLEILDLGNTRVTNRGLKHLMPLQELDWLLLSNNDITDAGLRQLEQMKGLKRLSLYGTAATRQGMSRIKKALPGLSVDFGPGDKAQRPKDGPPPEANLTGSGDAAKTIPDEKSGSLKDLIEPESVLKDIFGDDGSSEETHEEGLFSGMLGAHAKPADTPSQRPGPRRPAAPNAEVEAEQQAAEALRKLEVIVIAERLRADDPVKQITSLNFRRKEIDDTALEHVGKLFRLQSLDLAGTNLADDQLRHLSGLQSVANLVLGSTPITDAGLVHIKDLSGVHALHLSNTRISDNGLPEIAKMSQLRILDLSNTKVTDMGLGHLAPLGKLDWLLLSNDNITDAGLQQLEAMKGLKRLTIDGTRVTREGMSRIKRAVPKLSIDYGSGNKRR